MEAEQNIRYSRSCGQRWAYYLIATLIPFLLVSIWRSPLGTGYRPVVGFGSPLSDLMQAMIPEGIVFGIICLIAQYVFSHRTERISVSGCLFYIILWSPIWGLGVIAPSITVLVSFAGNLGPLKDVFFLGGLAGGFAAGFTAFFYAMISFFVVAGELAVASLWAGLVAPTMSKIASNGESHFRMGAPLLWNLTAAILAGSTFWIARLFLIAAVPNPSWRGIIDAGATVFIMGVWAMYSRRINLPENPVRVQPFCQGAP